MTQMDGSSVAQLIQISRGFCISQALFVAARLGIADLLIGGPMSCSELAQITATHKRCLYRLLRALASQGVFMEGPVECFSLNALSNFLRRDVEWSLRDSILYLGSPSYWAAWGYLLHSVETGEPSFDFVVGQSFYDRVDNDSKEAAAFHSAMLKNKSHQFFSTTYDFSGINEFVDVGGGSGALLNSILSGHPHMHGTLYDRPIAIEKSAAFFQSETMPERFSAISGDFFDSVPSGADAYILSLVLMDWENAKAKRILENCARSMRDNGRIIILERIITNGAANDVAFITDLTEMIITGGGLRTENEFSELLLGAGLRLTKVMRMPSGHCVLEARKPSRQAQTIS